MAGSLTSATVAVASGAALRGSGNITGSINAAPGANIYPGASPGNLTVTSAGFTNSTSQFTVELNGPTVASPGNTTNTYSRLTVTGSVPVALNGATLNPILGYNPSTADTLFIIDNQDPAGGVTGTFAQGSMFTVTYQSSTYSAQITYLADTNSGSVTGGNDVALYNFQPVPVPEPASILGFGAMALAACCLRRRNLNRRAAAISNY